MPPEVSAAGTMCPKMQPSRVALYSINLLMAKLIWMTIRQLIEATVCFPIDLSLAVACQLLEYPTDLLSRVQI